MGQTDIEFNLKSQFVYQFPEMGQAKDPRIWVKISSRDFEKIRGYEINQSMIGLVQVIRSI